MYLESGGRKSQLDILNSEGTGEVVSQCHLPDQVQTPAKRARVCPSTSTPLAGKQAFVGVDLLDCEQDPIEEDGQVILNENEDMALDLMSLVQAQVLRKKSELSSNVKQLEHEHFSHYNSLPISDTEHLFVFCTHVLVVCRLCVFCTLCVE